MMNQSANETGNTTPRSRDVRGWGRAGPLLLSLAIWASSSIAMAAEIVEVRVGRHDTFTRVVFELDRAAGYRIERAESKTGITELVVSVEAMSIPRQLSSPKSLIKTVDVEPSGRRSVARIVLAKDGLKLKEMILASPPRIVLDVLSDAPIVPMVAKAPVKAAPKPIAKSTPTAKTGSTKTDSTKTALNKTASAKTAGAEVAKTPSKSNPLTTARDSKTPAPVVKRDPKPIVVAAKPGVVEKNLGKDAAPALEAAADSDRVIEDALDSKADSWDVEMAAKSADDAIDPAADAVDRAHGLVAERAAAAKSAAAQKARRTPTPLNTPPEKPMVAESDSEKGGGWMTWSLAAVGVVVLLLGAAIVARKRSEGSEFDAEDEDSDAAESSADNPFSEVGGDDDQMNLGTSDDLTQPRPDAGATIVANPNDIEEKESESVVFDSEEDSMDSMEVISRDAVNESLGMPPEMGALPAEFQQMMRDMNSRVQSLEGRIDELVDARDRLERQVAAQTEELRVQRAAIARTQRAVRNLARPEDEEDEATEPALRDPNQPGSGE